MASRAQPELIAVRAERRILLVRGHRVLLDSDLATLYQVPTRRLNEQVRRNIARFPPDFMFTLTREEAEALRSQSATSKPGRGGRRYLPMVFTVEGLERRYDAQFRVVFDAIREPTPSGRRIGFKPGEP